MRNNKKGQLGESIQDLVCAIIIILLLVIFFIASNTLWHGSNVEIKKLSTKQAITNQEHISLQSWLQKPVTINKDGENDKGDTIKISELIILAHSNPSYMPILNEEAKKAFGEDYELKLLSANEILQKRIMPVFAGPSILFIPYVKEAGTLFYLPSRSKEKIIFVNLIKKK